MTASTPPPPYAQLRSESPLRSSSPVSPVSHKRRKSSCSSDVVERRPKKGDEDYIKRPENAFILFRRKCCEDRQQAEEEVAKMEGPAKKQRQADLSKTISQQWKSLSQDERQYWEQKAKDKKKEHEQLYPNYVYRPQRAKDKDGKPKGNKKSSLSKKFDYDESETVSFVVPVNRPYGRSASAPTPPPYQSIQIPNVYHMTPSCPTSPSLLPMISRRSAHPGHPEEVMCNFDFVPSQSNSYIPPSFAMPGQFEASLQVSKHISILTVLDVDDRVLFQSSEFLRSIYSTTTSQRHSEPSTQLQHLNIGSTDALLLPAHQIVSPGSSIGSGSSGPSSPATGPYTPTTSSLLSSHPYSQISSCGDAALDAQAQAEMELQMEMQMQQEFAAFSWGENNSMWNSEPSVLLGDDFDINAIPPIELGVPKYTENLSLAAPNSSGLEFGQEFAHALEGRHYHDESSQNMNGLIAFDEMMAGHNF